MGRRRDKAFGRLLRSAPNHTTRPGHDGHMAWSSDGCWLAFASNRAGWRDEAALHPYNAQNGDIYVMRADGSDVTVLTDDTFEKATPGSGRPTCPVPQRTRCATPEMAAPGSAPCRNSVSPSFTTVKT